MAAQATWYWADSITRGRMEADDQHDQINATTRENNHESDTNSSIRRTRSSGPSGNAASRTGCERSAYQGQGRLGQPLRLEGAGWLHEGFSSAHFAGHARVGCFGNH